MPTQTKVRPSTVKQKVDRVGEIKAEIDKLQKEMEKIKKYLSDRGIEEADGDLFHVKFCHVESRRTDYKAVVSEYNIPESVIEDHTTVKDSVRFLVSAR